MTSTSDEAANLRATLEHIKDYIAYQRKHGDPTDSNTSLEIMRTIEALVKDGLKTPRASKAVHALIEGGGLPPPSYP